MDRLVIVDPLNNQNNVGRCTFNINEIKVKNISLFIRKSFFFSVENILDCFTNTTSKL